MADKQFVELVDTNEQFLPGDTIRGLNTGITFELQDIENYRYSVVDFEPAYLSFNKTTLSFEMKPTSNTGVIGTFRSIDHSSNYYFNTEQAIFSKYAEFNDLAGERSNQVRISMRSSSEYLSPVIDLSRTHTVIINNIINSNTMNETASTGGELANKYISKIVTLAEGQDAEDMLIILTAYRPPGTNIKVWMKISNAEDGTPFNETDYIEMEMVAPEVYSSLASLNDFREYTFKFPLTSMTGPNGEVQYTSNGITYTGYKYFAIKIGLIADNTAIVPRVADLRALALQL
jgi:hypothetical protein